MLPFLLLTIPGCANAPARFDAPVVVELSHVRCPEPDATTLAEFRRTTPRPAGAISKDGVRKWIDTLEISERRKNLAGQRLADELARCRNVPSAKPAVS